MLNLADIKCGEIYYSNDNFIYNCIFCDKQINDIQQFRSHYIQCHKINNTTSEFSSFKLEDDYCESKSDFQRLIDGENISVSEKSDELQSLSLKETGIVDYKDDKTNINLNTDETNKFDKLKSEIQLPVLTVSDKYNDLDSPSQKEIEINCEQDSSSQEEIEIGCEKDDYKITNFNADNSNHKQQTVNKCVEIRSKKKLGVGKVKEFPCEICGRIYQRPKKLKSHMETHVPGYLTCNICKQTLNNKRNLKIHIKLHNGETFDCTICEAKFSRKGNLKQHILRHKNEKPFACKYENCNLRFINNSVLRAHELIHTGEKPLVCEFCGRSFINITALKEHIKRHTNQRDFKCSHCDKKFFDKKLLKDHEIGHTRVKNFVCNICSVYFLRKKSLRCHMKKHSDIKNYKCKICNDSFSLYNDMAYHIKKKHNVTKIINKI